jgi:Domain of unknown function (DUF4276)
MVTVKIVIEGGIVPHKNDASQTIDNSEKLRESFHKLFRQAVDPESFDLEIEMGAGIANTCNLFKRQIKSRPCTMLIDLDRTIDKKQERLNDLGLTEYAAFVFFMVQEMEAWILSQPEAIEKGMQFLNRKNPGKKISDDPIFSKNPIEIVHPSDKLNTVLGRFFYHKNQNKKKKKKYGKIKDAPLFIKELDLCKLTESFVDMENLVGFLNQSSNQ